MTTESTQPQTELGPAPANGQGQSQGHRRRRRRRKNKSQAGAAQAVQAQPRATLRHKRPAARRKPQQTPAYQNQGGSRAAARATAGRRRSSSRRARLSRSSPATASHSPGNVGTGQAQEQAEGPARVCRPHGPQLPRRERQRGRRSSLDHSDHQQRPQRLLSGRLHGAAVRFRSAKTRRPRIFCFIEDLFFLAKIQETARKLGVKVEFRQGRQGFGGQADRRCRSRAAHAGGL